MELVTPVALVENKFTYFAKFQLISNKYKHLSNKKLFNVALIEMHLYCIRQITFK